MKKIINIFMPVLLITGFSACSDFLNQTSPSELNDETVYNSVYYTGLRVNKIYGAMTLDETYSQYIPIDWSANTDCELIDGLGAEASNTSSERGNMNYNANPGWGNIAKLWNAMYGIIEDANLVIEGISNSSLLESGSSDEAATMLYYKGEALTLRAMAYFDLLRFFGDIPLKMETTNTDLSNVYLEKTDRDIIMDLLIVDLKEAINSLPWAGEAGYTTERITKGYAHALLANIALTRAGWSIRETAKEGYITASFSDPIYPTQRCNDEKRQEMYELALVHLSEIIKSGKHKLNESIENHWYLINQRKLDVTYRENIFEIPMGLDKSGELGYRIGVRVNGATEKYGRNSSGKIKMTAPFFWSFKHNDLRRDLTCAHYQLVETGGTLKEEMLKNAPFGMYCAKWDIRKMTEDWRLKAAAAAEAKIFTGINVVRMRYPQILLMFAEVMNDLYGADVANAETGLSARDALKDVHVRSFAEANKDAARLYVTNIPADKDAFFNAIVNENAWELAGEGFRKQDLIRWNLLSSKIDKFKADYQAQLSQYPEKLYFKYNSDNTIDMSSICWYEEPASTTGYESETFFGNELITSTKTQLETNLPSISAGLNAVVINRYLLPIASTTISASNGTLKNSYGYSN